MVGGHLGDEDLVVGDVRGPNAHTRGHIPGSRPLVLGSPPPAADEETARALAEEIALRLRRHGITGRERLVLVDRGDGVGAMPALQMAELAGHPNVAVLLGGMAGWQGELEEGTVELEPVREADLEPNPRALPTRQELLERLGDESLTILDVRTPDEYTGRRGSACDPRQGTSPARGSSSSASCSTDRGSRPRRIECASSSACPRERRSWRTATRARARRWRRSRCGRPATTRGTTPARGTSGAGTTTSRSNAKPAGR